MPKIKMEITSTRPSGSASGMIFYIDLFKQEETLHPETAKRVVDFILEEVKKAEAELVGKTYNPDLEEEFKKKKDGWPPKM